MVNLCCDCLILESIILDFTAIHIIKGVVSSYTDYRSLQYRFGVIADLMPIKRNQKIRRYLHFVVNSTDNSDRYHKIRSIVEKIRANCLAQEVETKFSIEEMMLPYKGTNASKRCHYMKDKSNKWDFKNYVRWSIRYNLLYYGYWLADVSFLFTFASLGNFADKTTLGLYLNFPRISVMATTTAKLAWSRRIPDP